jgi:hypothetical protein
VDGQHLLHCGNCRLGPLKSLRVVHPQSAQHFPRLLILKRAGYNGAKDRDNAPHTQKEGPKVFSPETKTMNLSANFWKTHRGLVLIASDQTLRFTPAGRKHYAPRMAKFGFVLNNIQTYDRFCEVMNIVTEGELETNTRSLEAILQSPESSAVERELIRRVLGQPGAAYSRIVASTPVLLGPVTIGLKNRVPISSVLRSASKRV